MPITRCLCVCLFTLMLCGAASAAVSVKREPADIQRKTFDPANPPKEMPHLEHNEAAVTATSFRILAGANFEPVTRTKGDDGWTTIIHVRGLTITLQLHVTIWTPQGVTDKLKAHEEGHRKIAEQVYEKAIAEAKAAGTTVDGKRFTGEGPDWKTAASNAVNDPVNAMGKLYLKHTADVVDEVGNIYDDLTQHGTNDKAEDDAIKEAFTKYAENHAPKKAE